MNVYDSARLTDVLTSLDYHSTDRPEQADVILLNTCHIREKASEKLFSELGRLHAIKKSRHIQGYQTIITVIGCVAQAEGEEILARAPFVDLILGPQTYHRFARLIDEAQNKAHQATIIDISFPTESKFDHMRQPVTSRGVSAFLTVQEGCDKFCTFCVVPYTRGAEFSRPVSAILTEAQSLIKQGIREITLLGQNVSAYHGEGPRGHSWSLARLMYALAELEGLDRLRYTTSHPRDIKEDLISAHHDLPILMPALHLPVQSGSDRILAAMNRGHTVKAYRDLIDRLRKARDDLALSSDFIVGFPSETQADFQETLRLVADIGYAHAYSFHYSARPGTPAASLTDHIASEVKHNRLQELQSLLSEQQNRFNRSFIDRRVPVLFAHHGRYPGQWRGRTAYMQTVYVEATSPLIGHMIDVEIVKAHTNSLKGQLSPHSTTMQNMPESIRHDMVTSPTAQG